MVQNSLKNIKNLALMAKNGSKTEFQYVQVNQCVKISNKNFLNGVFLLHTRISLSKALTFYEKIFNLDF